VSSGEFSFLINGFLLLIEVSGLFSGKFSVFGGSGISFSLFSSNHFFICGMSGVSLLSSPLVSCQYKAVVLIEECPNSFCNKGNGIPKLAWWVVKLRLNVCGVNSTFLLIPNSLLTFLKK